MLKVFESETPVATFLQWTLLAKVLVWENTEHEKSIFTLRYDEIPTKTDSCVLEERWLQNHLLINSDPF